jgi:hypothetical protein
MTKDIQIKKVEIPDIFKNRHRDPTIYYPVEIENHVGCTGYLYGYYHESTHSFNVITLKEEQTSADVLPLKEIGRIFSVKPSLAEIACIAGYICAYWDEGELFFYAGQEPCKKEPYSLKMDVFSRNTGILETDIMMRKGALIIGCGSVGSIVALELARAGVGRFLLLDSDILGYHNICRHQCGVADVGKYKTDAVKERILQINPQAEVEVRHCLVQEVSLDVLGKFCNPEIILVDCADNRDGGLYANNMAKQTKSAFMSIGCWERASAGEIFYWLPLPEGMPEYKHLINTGISRSVNQNRQFYTTEEELAKTVFEPGISADITFVTIISTKLIIDILNRDNPQYTPRLLNHLTHFTLICNTNNEKIGGQRVAIFSYPLQITTSIEVSKN